MLLLGISVGAALREDGVIHGSCVLAFRFGVFCVILDFLAGGFWVVVSVECGL